MSKLFRKTLSVVGLAQEKMNLIPFIASQSTETSPPEDIFFLLISEKDLYQKNISQINLQQIAPITTKLLKDPILHTKIKTLPLCLYYSFNKHPLRIPKYFPLPFLDLKHPPSLSLISLSLSLTTGSEHHKSLVLFLFLLFFSIFFGRMCFDFGV
jgi:hypothetical protein